MNRHFKEHHFEQLNKSKSFAELAEVAFDVLDCMPKPIVQVCGPISTGGKGSIEANLKEFEKAIRRLLNKNHNVFNQMPFEKPMQRIRAEDKSPGYPMKLLEDFYLPIFESGHIHELIFLPGWQSSFGAKWEYEQANRLGLKISHFDGNWDI